MKNSFLFVLNTLTIIKSLPATARPFLLKNQLITDDLPPQGFGKYYVTVRYIEKCTAEPVDTKNNNIHNLIVTKHNETFEEIMGYLVVPNNHKCTLSKFTPAVLRNGVLRPTFNRTVEHPCKDIIMSIPMKMTFHTDESCLIHKGNYTLENMDPNKWAHLALGENFMYERVHCTVEYFTNAGSTFCLYLVIDIRPLPKYKRKPKKQ